MQISFKFLRNAVAISFLLLLTLASFGQSTLGQTTTRISFQEEETEEDQWKGFSAGLNIGMYLASKQSAVFYNGTCSYNLNEGNGRCYSIEERLSSPILSGELFNVITGQLGAESFTIPRDSYPANPRYKAVPMIGLHVRYSFNRTNALFMDFNVMRLKMVDVFTLRTNLIPDGGQGSDDIRTFSIEGREERFQFSLGYHTSNPMQGDMNWYFDAAGTVLGTKPVENFLVIEGTEYQLFLQQTPGTIQHPNTFTVPRTHVGLGGMLGTGIEFYFQEKYFMSLGFQLSYDDVAVGSFEKRLFNKAFVARFTI